MRTEAAARAESQTFVDLVPATYLLAMGRYGFLPARCVALDVWWAEASPTARAVFVLDYVSRLYRVPASMPLEVAAVKAAKPLIIVRTLDHPAAGGQLVVQPELQGYSVFFDLDTGVRLELQMGARTFDAFARVMTPIVDLTPDETPRRPS